MRWWGNGSISEISVAKAGLKRCPYVNRRPSTTTRTTSGSAVKSIAGATSEALPFPPPNSYPPRDSYTRPFVKLFFFNVYKHFQQKIAATSATNLSLVRATYQIIQYLSRKIDFVRE